MNKQVNTPLVSVIVPIYNVEKYLHRCVDSLLNQTLKEIEIILVNDGSPDNSAEIIDTYANKYENIIPLHKVNGGLSDARNAGLNIAKGEYIGFVDPDDYVEHDMFEKMYLSAVKNKSDLVFAGYNEIFSDNYTEKRTFEFIYNFKKVSDILKASIEGQIGAYAWNKLYKTSVIKENSILFPKGVVVVEDQVFFYEFIKHISSFSVVTDCLYNYIRNDSSICAKYHNRQFEFYKIGFAAHESAILHFGKEIEEYFYIKDKLNMLTTLLNVLDTQASVRNKISISARYNEMCKLISDTDFLKLISDYGDKLTNKVARKKVKYINFGRKKSLFLYEFYRMRIIAIIKYYIG